MPEAGNLSAPCSGRYEVWRHIPPPQDHLPDAAPALTPAFGRRQLLPRLCSRTGLGSVNCAGLEAVMPQW